MSPHCHVLSWGGCRQSLLTTSLRSPSPPPTRRNHLPRHPYTRGKNGNGRPPLRHPAPYSHTTMSRWMKWPQARMPLTRPRELCSPNSWGKSPLKMSQYWETSSTPKVSAPCLYAWATMSMCTKEISLPVPLKTTTGGANHQHPPGGKSMLPSALKTGSWVHPSLQYGRRNPRNLRRHTHQRRGKGPLILSGLRSDYLPPPVEKVQGQGEQPHASHNETVGAAHLGLQKGEEKKEHLRDERWRALGIEPVESPPPSCRCCRKESLLTHSSRPWATLTLPQGLLPHQTPLLASMSSQCRHPPAPWREQPPNNEDRLSST